MIKLTITDFDFDFEIEYKYNDIIVIIDSYYRSSLFEFPLFPTFCIEEITLPAFPTMFFA